MEGLDSWGTVIRYLLGPVLALLASWQGKRKGWWEAFGRWIITRFNLEKDNARLRIENRYLTATLIEQSQMIDDAARKAERAASLTGLLESSISTGSAAPRTESLSQSPPKPS